MRRAQQGTVLLVVTMMGILLLGAASLYVGAIHQSLRQAQRLENRLAASHRARGLFDVVRRRIAQGKIAGKHADKGGKLEGNGTYTVAVAPAKRGLELRVMVTISRKIPSRTIVEIAATLARDGAVLAYKETSRVSNPEKSR